MELIDRLRDVAAVAGVCAFAMTIVLGWWIKSLSDWVKAIQERSNADR